MAFTRMTAVLEEVTEQRVLWVPERPVTFEEFLTLFGNDDVELIDGMVVPRMAAQLEHERLFAWLLTLLNLYAAERDLGIVLGSRTPVEINQFRARLPDLFFVRRERLEIVQQKGVYGAPDLVIELVSPNDRPSDLIALETDYRAIGVPEIWFVDQQQRSVRVLHSRSGDYDEERLEPGAILRSDVLSGLLLETAWLLIEPRPFFKDALLISERGDRV